MRRRIESQECRARDGRGAPDDPVRGPDLGDERLGRADPDVDRDRRAVGKRVGLDDEPLIVMNRAVRVRAGAQEPHRRPGAPVRVEREAAFASPQRRRRRRIVAQRALPNRGGTPVLDVEQFVD